MLDPRELKCGVCYENQDRYNIRIPDCSNPKGDGKPCPYPTIKGELWEENILAWEIFLEVIDQVVNLTPMSEPTFILNLESLRFAMSIRGIENDENLYHKVRTLFSIWQEVIKKSRTSETDKSLRKLKTIPR